jgi:DNA polymerase V
MPINPNDKQALTFHAADSTANIGLPYAEGGVSAGFPSPADDFLEQRIDLNKELAKNPLTTFFIKVAGNSMVDAGLDNGDVLVADRSLEPADGKIAICQIDGEFTVKRLKLNEDGLYLMPENKSYEPIKITEANQFVVWAIVTYVIKKVV